ILRGAAGGVTRVGLNEMGFAPAEVLSAAGTVALFLFVATLASSVLLVGIAKRSNRVTPEVISGSQLNKLIVVGLAGGIGYYTAVLTGLLAWLGPNCGFVRAVMLSAAMVACFLLGHARARGLIRGRRWALALASVIAMTGFAWLSLFLIGGVLHCLAVMAGYIITSKRAPW